MFVFVFVTPLILLLFYHMFSFVSFKNIKSFFFSCLTTFCDDTTFLNKISCKTRLFLHHCFLCLTPPFYKTKVHYNVVFFISKTTYVWLAHHIFSQSFQNMPGLKTIVSSRNRLKSQSQIYATIQKCQLQQKPQFKKNMQN